VSALTVSPLQHRIGLYFKIHRRNISSEDVSSFVLSVMRHLRRKIILVLDSWSVHKGAVNRLLESHRDSIDVEWLPTYAPELNPVEQVWNHTKFGELANYIPEDLDELSFEVEESMVGKRSNQSLLRSFFKHAGLDL